MKLFVLVGGVVEEVKGARGGIYCSGEWEMPLEFEIITRLCLLPQS